MGLTIEYLDGKTPLDEFEQNTYPADEIALRFKHQIVSIHCFSNGNGRHSRLMADLIIDKLFQKPVFTWGAHRKQTQKETRTAYLQALKKADLGNFVSLIEFARS
jgi:fido (protein-threonine AMPylation protein)